MKTFDGLVKNTSLPDISNSILSIKPAHAELFGLFHLFTLF